MNEKSEIPLSKCAIESDGTVTCSLSKAKFDVMSSKGIKPRKIIFEIE